MTLNVIVGILQVAASLYSVYAMRYAIDVASHAVEGDILNNGDRGSDTVRVCPFYLRGMDTQHSRHKGSEQDAAGNAGEGTEVRMAQRNTLP